MGVSGVGTPRRSERGGRILQTSRTDQRQRVVAVVVGVVG